MLIEVEIVQELRGEVSGKLVFDYRKENSQSLFGLSPISHRSFPPEHFVTTRVNSGRKLRDMMG